MNTWIALLRGVNVGGKNKLAMKPLAMQLQDAGLCDVRTYIQSGNLVFASAEKARTLAALITGVIAEHHGFAPGIQLLDADALQAAVDANPYPVDQPKLLHLFFLKNAPEPPGMQALQALRAPSEQITLTGQTLFLFAPEGIGRSRLAKGVEKALGMDATARNWQTVCRVLAMAQPDTG